MSSRKKRGGALLTPLIASLLFAALPEVATAGSSKKEKPARTAVAKKVKPVKASVSRSARAERSKETYRARNRVARKAVAVPRAAARVSVAHLSGLHSVDDPLDLTSAAAVAMDQRTGEILFAKNPNAVLPIASITKLVTALVTIESKLPLHEMLEITDADRDLEKHTSSRLAIGSRLSRGEMLHLALMASENRAASALARHYPGGAPAFIAEMNRRVRSLGMKDTFFADSTGLSSRNVSTAADLALLVRAAYHLPLIREYSTASNLTVDTAYRVVTFRSTNRLIDRPDWEIGLQKTGYISEAGNCLVMQTRLDGSDYIMVLLDSQGSSSRIADVKRLRRWLEKEPSGSGVRAIRVSASSDKG